MLEPHRSDWRRLHVAFFGLWSALISACSGGSNDSPGGTGGTAGAGATAGAANASGAAGAVGAPGSGGTSGSGGSAGASDAGFDAASPYACGWIPRDPGNLVSTGANEGDVVENIPLIDQCGDQLPLWDLAGEYHLLFMTTVW